MKRALMVTSAVVLVMASTAVYAQDTAAGQGPAPREVASADVATAGTVGEGEGEGEIVVTAQKRSETLQRTAAAVAVVGADQLVARGVTDLNRLTTQVTGILFTPQRSGVQIFSRGLGQSDGQQQTTASVEVDMDGVGLPKSAQQFALFDIANVQVLKGPQGILYGRNAIGGAVLINSVRPDPARFRAEARLEVGNYDLIHPFAAINVPLGGETAIRAAVDYQNRGGYLSNGANDIDQIAGRISFATRAIPDLSVFVAVTYADRSGMGFSQVSKPDPAGANGDPWFVAPVPQSGIVGGVNFGLRENRGFNDSQALLINGELIYDLTESLSLTYVGGYLHYRSEQVNAVQVAPRGVFVSNISNYYIEDSDENSNELRLRFDRDGFDFVLGAFTRSFKAPGAILQTSFRAGRFVTGPVTQRERNRALFANLRVPITEAVRVEAGVRASWDRKGAVGTLTGSVVDINPDNFADFTNTSWKLGVEADLAPRVLAYASVQTGYLPGAYQTASQATLNSLGLSRRYREQTLTAYTVGAKSRLFDNRLTLNVEGFYYDYSNFQVNQRVELSPGSGLFQTPYANIEKSRILGVDVDVGLQVGTGGRASAGASFLSTRILDAGLRSLFVLQSDGRFLPSADPSLNGSSLPNAPELTLNLGYDQTFALGSGAELVASVSTHHQSSRFLDYTQPDVPGAIQPSFWKTDASLTYNAAGGRWNVALWVRNIENTATYNAFSGSPLRSTPTGPLIGSYGLLYIDPPRTFGVRAGINF